MNAIIKKNGISFGVIIGVLSILFATLTYVFRLYTSWWVGLLSFAVSIVLYCVLLSKTKKELGGVYSFKEAFTTFFIAAVIAVVVATLYNVVLYNFVDPGAKEIVKEETIKSTVKIMESMGTPNSAINEAVDNMQNDDPFSVSKQLLGAAIALAISCVLGLILALIFKSRTTHTE